MYAEFVHLEIRRDFTFTVSVYFGNVRPSLVVLGHDASNFTPFRVQSLVGLVPVLWKLAPAVRHCSTGRLFSARFAGVIWKLGCGWWRCWYRHTCAVPEIVPAHLPAVPIGLTPGTRVHKPRAYMRAAKREASKAMRRLSAFMASVASGAAGSRGWLVDSGANRHFSSVREDFTCLRPVARHRVTGIDVEVHGVCDVRIPAFD